MSNTTHTTQDTKATSSGNTQAEPIKKDKPIRDTQESLVAKVNLAKARALKEQDPEPMVQTSRAMISLFMGDDYKEDYFMFNGVRVVAAEVDIEELLDKESESIEFQTKAF